MQRILVVEDDFDIQELLQNFLQEAGYEVAVANDGVEALSLFSGQRYDLIILDILLPKIDGYGVCELIRKQSDVPIIMLTALSGEEDQIRGLDLQVDDYITKPLNPLELVARVKAQLRRYKKYNPSQENVNVIDFKGLIIDNDSHRCTLYDEVLNLTPIEFSILWYLCKNRGRVITSEELFEAVWKEKYFDSNNTVMVHIRRLREKMHEPPRNPKFIKTVWGVGYQIEE